MLALSEPEALKIAVVFEEQAREQYKQTKEQKKQQSRADTGGFTEPGFEVELDVGDDDPNDYLDSRPMTDEEEIAAWRTER